VYVLITLAILLYSYNFTPSFKCFLFQIFGTCQLEVPPTLSSVTLPSLTFTVPTITFDSATLTRLDSYFDSLGGEELTLSGT